VILVDTSVWIDHLRIFDAELAGILEDGRALAHPYIVGELACGNLRSRGEFLGLLQGLPQASAASDDEVLLFIEQRRLMGLGIGYIDAHLLVATALTADARLWTRDKRLATAAHRLGLGVTPGS